LGKIGEEDCGCLIRVWTVLGYGVEVWGWREREVMEKLEEIFEMGVRSRQRNARLLGKRGTAERKVEGKSRATGMGI